MTAPAIRLAEAGRSAPWRLLWRRFLRHKLAVASLPCWCCSP